VGGDRGRLRLLDPAFSLGRAFRAIRENEMRAEVVGVSLRNYKLMAFAIGAAYAGRARPVRPLLGSSTRAFTLDRSIHS